MLSTSARLLRLLTLLSNRRHWSGRDLAERLEVDARTVRRDVDRLRELGYPVQASAGLGGGYQLGGGSTMPPVSLGDDEAVAMAVALRAAASSVGGMEEVTLGLLSKLERLLPAHLQARVTAFESVMHSAPRRGAKPDVDVLVRVASACRDHQRTRLAYRDRTGRESERDIEPLHLVHSGIHWYLVAWDGMREDFRTFRMDRARDVRASGGTFAPRRLPVDAAEFVSRSVSVMPRRYEVRVHLRGSLDELAARVPCWCGVLEAKGARSCVLHAGAESLEGVAAQLLTVGAPIERVEAPFLPELRAVLDRLRGAIASTPPGKRAGGRAHDDPSSRARPSRRSPRGSTPRSRA